MAEKVDYVDEVISRCLLEAVDYSLPLDPAFDIGMSEWLPEDYQRRYKAFVSDKENSPCPDPAKKKLKLSLQKKSASRFSTVSNTEQELAAKGVIPDNTKHSNEWALRNLTAWMSFRNAAKPLDPVPTDLLSCQDAAVLCKWLCCYVQETKKENGEPYPATTIRSLLSGIQRTLQANKLPFNLFDKSDLRFRDLHNTLDCVSVSLRKKGVGTEVNHSAVMSIEDENAIWDKGVAGDSSPWPLLRASFLTVGLHFSLRGGQEHRDLKVSQLRRVPASGYDDNTYYVYIENGSKNYQGRFSETGQQNKVVKAFAQPQSKRCPVKILDKYIAKLPPGCKTFYMQPLASCPVDPEKPWFKNVPVGVNPLRNMMPKISELAGLSRYTNHSLRATSATRMFNAGVPEKIVAEVTGHKSLGALRQYERTTDIQCKAVGESISTMQPFSNCTSNDSEPNRKDGANNVLGLQNLISGKLDNCSIVFNINSK